MFRENPGRTGVLKHSIDSGNTRPLRCNPRPISVHKRALLDKALKEMTDTGAVRASQSPWAFPIVLALKEDRADKLKAITEFPLPRDAKSLQRFPGMVGFYRQFIPHCAEITRPLNERLRKGVKWRWTEAQQNASLQLFRAIAETASLKLPDLNRPFVLQTDARGYGLGAVLLQDFDGVLRPVAFASHTLTADQRNCNVCELECLTIIFALQKFNMYLDGARFVIQSDNAALSWLQRLENPAGRLARWPFTHVTP